MENDKSKVLVIVVTYNAIKWLKYCFDSIYNSTLPLDVMVVDNGSNDGTQECIMRDYPNSILYQSKQNLGFGRANNLGLQYALEHNYDYVYLLNQDAWLKPNTLEVLININRKYPEFGILSPFQLQGNEQNMDVNFASSVCSYFSNNHFINDLYFSRLKEVYEVSDVMAAHWLISKDCIRKVGGFSPTFPHYGEDNNYADRAIYHGFKLGIVPIAVAVHDRESRKISKENEIYKTYTISLMRLSNIYKVDNRPLFHLIFHMLYFAFKYNSMKPISYMFRILRNYRLIKSNNEVSKKECAFLIPCYSK